jgi:EmrB/QacA subfamily drug resistance transporter
MILVALGLVGGVVTKILERHRHGSGAEKVQVSGEAVNRKAVTAVVCLALAAVVSALASLNVALPDLARSTGATQTQLEWIIDAYSLIFASLLLPAGFLGDRYGRRRALIGGLIVFSGASVLAFTSSSPNELIVLRGIIGAGAAFVMPATLSTITTTFPAEQRTRAVGSWAAVAGGSAVVGLVCSGLLLEAFSWRSVFAVNIVVGTVALVGVVRFVPESSHARAVPLDKGGALFATAGLVALVFSIIEAPNAGWASEHTLAGLGAACAIFVGFIVWELHQTHPLLDPRLFQKGLLTSGSSSIFVQFFAFYGFTFVILQYLQGVRGDSPLMASLLVLPLAAAMMPMGRLTPRLVARVGARRVAVGGLVLIGIGLVVASRVGMDTSYWLLLAGLVPLGLGMGAATIPATTSITEALPQTQQGVGSAVNDLSREVGGALGIAVIGSILTATYRADLHLTMVPAALAAKARGSFALAVHAGGPVRVAANSAFVSGIHVALLCAAGTAFLAAVAVAVLRRQRQPERVRIAVAARPIPATAQIHR